MSRIKWNDGLSVGIELIDQQHKMLLQRIDDITLAIEKHHGEVKIGTTLQFLAEYTDFHFSTEEKYMTELDYPGLDYQKTQHQEFKNTLKNLTDDFLEEGATHTLAASIDTFLINWFVKHIKAVDIKFADFLNEKGLQITE